MNFGTILHQKLTLSQNFSPIFDRFTQKGPAESPPLGERNAKSTLGLWKTAKTYIYMYINKIFPKKPVETGVYSMLNG